VTSPHPVRRAGDGALEPGMESSVPRDNSIPGRPHRRRCAGQPAHERRARTRGRRRGCPIAQRRARTDPDPGRTTRRRHLHRAADTDQRTGSSCAEHVRTRRRCPRTTKTPPVSAGSRSTGVDAPRFVRWGSDETRSATPLRCPGRSPIPAAKPLVAPAAAHPSHELAELDAPPEGAERWGVHLVDTPAWSCRESNPGPAVPKLGALRA
jgi:hypothetical protein